MTDAASLFQPYKLGDLTLRNRIVMAPLTRNRASGGDIPNDLMVEYYRQRASAGLIVSEASQISHQGQGYIHTPGIYTDAQVAGWRRVTDAVHEARRLDLHPALACRARVACFVAAGRRRASRPLGHSRQHQDFY